MNGYQREELEYSDQAKTSELKLELFVIVGYWHWFSSQKKREQFTHLYIEYKSKAPTFQTSYSDFVKLSTCHSSCVRFSRFWTLFVGSKKSGLLYASAWSLEAYLPVCLPYTLVCANAIQAPLLTWANLLLHYPTYLLSKFAHNLHRWPYASCIHLWHWVPLGLSVSWRIH